MDRGGSQVAPAGSGDPIPEQPVLDAIPCLILVIDRESGVMLQVNAALEAVTGQSRWALLGMCWEALFEPADQERVRAAFSWGDRPALGVETSILTRQGDRRRVLWSIAMPEKGSGAPAQVVLSGVDVTPELGASGLFSQLVRTSTAPALVGADLNGRVNLYNSVAERMLGYPAAHVIGRVFDIGLFEPAELADRAERLGVPADLRLFTGDLSKLDRRRSNPDLGALDRRGHANRQPAEWRRRPGESRVKEREQGDRRAGGRRGGLASLARDWTLIKNGGERITVSLVVVKVTDNHGEVVGYLAVANDVTEQRRSGNLLLAGLEKETEAVRRLQELDRAKDDFVATVSHELRTPITSIMGYVELLLDAQPSDVSPAYAKMLQAVQRNGDRLCALADNLLTLLRFESEEFSLHLTQVDLGAVVGRVEEALRPVIGERRLEVRFEVPARPILTLGDAEHLERVLLNLMSNALKFTEDGGSITCSLTRGADGAVLEVSDTGIGIPVEEQEHLFTRFFRSSTAQERAIQGTGMGLAIVSSIVNRHGGEIDVRSESGSGTRVRVFLPISKVPGVAV